MGPGAEFLLEGLCRGADLPPPASLSRVKKLINPDPQYEKVEPIATKFIRPSLHATGRHDIRVFPPG